MRRERVFVDTSGFKALLDKKDEFHREGARVWRGLEQEEVLLVTTNYVLDETFTLLRARCGMEILEDFRGYIVKSAPVLRIERVIIKDEALAWEWMIKDWSKLSFTDCVSFSVMKRLGIQRVVGFDAHFKKAGFLLEKSFWG